jgi:hypothetical protein
MSKVGRKAQSKVPDNPELARFNLGILVSDILRDEGGPDLLKKVIWEMATRGGLTWVDIKPCKPDLPSFSNAAWKNVAPRFNLDPDKNFHQLLTFSFPVTSLPPSFHKTVMTLSRQWLDVYQERGAHRREAARVRLMDAVRALNFLV